MGHAWTFVEPENDLIISSKDESAKLSIIENSAVAKVIRAEITLMIPADTPRASDRLDWRKTTREAKDMKPQLIESFRYLPYNSR